MTGSCIYSRKLSKKLAKPIQSILFWLSFCTRTSLSFCIKWYIFYMDLYSIIQLFTSKYYFSRRFSRRKFMSCFDFITKITSYAFSKMFYTFSGKSYHSKELFDSALNSGHIHNAKNWRAFIIAPYICSNWWKCNFIGWFKILYTPLLKNYVYVKLDIFPRPWYLFQMSPIKSTKEAMTKVYHFI